MCGQKAIHFLPLWIQLRSWGRSIQMQVQKCSASIWRIGSICTSLSKWLSSVFYTKLTRQYIGKSYDYISKKPNPTRPKHELQIVLYAVHFMLLGWTIFGPWTSMTNGSTLGFSGMAVWMDSLGRSSGWLCGGIILIQSLSAHNTSTQSEVLVSSWYHISYYVNDLWYVIRCTMRHPKWPRDWELQCGLCAHLYSPYARPFTFWFYLAQVEAWSLKH